MANLVKYGSFDFYSVCGHDPFVGVEDEAIIIGGKFQTFKKVTIQGKIFECDNDDDKTTAKINTLLNNLNQDFLTLEAGGITLYYAKCESVDINQSNFYGGADFTVVFSAYPSSLSEIGYSVLDPVDNKQFTQNPDGTINITRSISVKGITNNKSALENARDFINTLNITDVPQLFLIQGQLSNPGTNIKPRRIVETINRLEGSISVDIDFIYRETAPSNNYILSYSVDISYDDKSGIYDATINGNLAVSDLDNNSEDIINDLRTQFNRLSLFSYTLNIFNKITGFAYLNPEPQTFSVKESKENNSINFSYSYTSDPYNVKSIISYSLDSDYATDTYQVSINGSLTAKGPQKTRTEALEKALQSLNLFTLASSFLNKQGVRPIPLLNSNPINYSITRNKSGLSDVNSINIAATYSNRYEEKSSDILKFDYNLTANPSIRVYIPVQFINGQNGVFNMNFHKRGSISINGSALAKNGNSAGQIRSLALSKLNEVASAVGASTRIRVDDNVTTPIQSNDGYSYSFSISDNCETQVEV